MKDIKPENYLHLYLGCKAIIYQGEPDSEVFTLNHLDYEYKGAECWEMRVIPRDDDGKQNDKSYLKSVPVQLIKPILRKLDSLTEEERDKYHKLVVVRERSMDEIIVKEAHGIKYLLSIGIDLFNLIDSGLAIDSKSLNV